MLLERSFLIGVSSRCCLASIKTPVHRWTEYTEYTWCFTLPVRSGHSTDYLMFDHVLQILYHAWILRLSPLVLPRPQRYHHARNAQPGK